MGEAIHLNNEERKQLIKTARRALDEAGLEDIGLLVGCGAPSTRATIKLVKEAAEAGADQAMVILDGYYAGLLQSNPLAIENHFVEVAESSPIPVMLYNFPAVTSGIDLDHTLVKRVAERAPNTCGIKLTCANVGKLTRLAASVRSEAFDERFPRKIASAPFLLLDGQIDILLSTVPVGADGCIGGVPNFAPIACARLWDLCQKDLTADNLQEVKALQAVIARGDYVASRAGIPGMKMLLNHLFGYGPNPRRPLPTLEDEDLKRVLSGMKEILDLEEGLSRQIA